MLHTMLRVRDLDAALQFFCDKLGLKVLRRRDVEAGRFTLVFLSTGTPGDSAEIELTHNWDQTEPYEIGTAWGHIALAVNDIHALCAELAEQGVNITRPPGPMKHSATVIAFIQDPDGYKIELIQRQ